MAPRDTAIESVKKRLPRLSGSIEREYRESVCFRAICADFHECCQTLTHWKSTGTNNATVRLQEYGELLEELTEEILRWLDSHNGVMNERTDDEAC